MPQPSSASGSNAVTAITIGSAERFSNSVNFAILAFRSDPRRPDGTHIFLDSFGDSCISEVG